MSNATETNPVTELVVSEAKGLELLNRAEIDIQIATAKKYPRSVTKALDMAKQFVTMNKETAQQMFYAMPIQGTVVVGPSIRLAEILQSCWGNIEFGSAPLEVTEKEVKAMGYCRDRESNISYQTVKSRPIVGKSGKRYPEHLITKTMLAAQAIAERDAICKVIPKAYVNQLFQDAMACAESGETFEKRMQSAMGWFSDKGVTEQQIYDHLGVAGIKDLTPENVRYLRMLAEGIKQGEITVEEVFAPKSNSGVKLHDEPKANDATPDAQREKVIKSLHEQAARISNEVFDLAVKTIGEKYKIKKNTPADKWEMTPLLDLLKMTMEIAGPETDRQAARDAEE